MNDTKQHEHEHDPDADIRAAYDRLGATVHPPGDGPRRVQHRIAVRRRRRRTAAGLAALALAGGVGAAALTTGGEPDRAVDVTTPPDGPVSTLATVRPDGTTYTFEEVEVTCVDGTITAQSPRRLVGEGEDQRLAEPYLYIEARAQRVVAGRALTLPVDGPGGSDTYPVLLFFAMDGDRGANELTSAGGGASGTVEVLEAACAPEPRLALRVDAVLGSEVGQEPMPLTGELR